MKAKNKASIVVEVVKFSAEKWIYERERAYPMVASQEVTNGKSSLGKYFNYQPVIVNTKVVLSDGDYIIKGVEGLFYSCKPEIFYQTYEIFNDNEKTNTLSIPKHLADNLLNYPDYLQTEEDIDEFMFSMYDTYETETYATYDEIKAYLNPLTRPFVIVEEE